MKPVKEIPLAPNEWIVAIWAPNTYKLVVVTNFGRIFEVYA